MAGKFRFFFFFCRVLFFFLEIAERLKLFTDEKYRVRGNISIVTEEVTMASQLQPTSRHLSTQH